MASRAVISIRGHDGSTSSTVPLPAVFSAPIRSDIVQQIHKSVAKNRRQPYAVSEKAGHQTSAESWGTGRAVARIPRVGGAGTHRTGQAAFGNMCRGGRMFAPTKTWRKFHVKVPLLQKRFATVSAIAASALPALVMARGHLISNVEEIPLVVGNSLEKVSKTKEAYAILKTLGASDEISKVIKSKKLRAGKGKYRNRRHRQRLGPLVVYGTDEGISRGFRNLPGVDVCDVRNLNLLQLAPGGHLGRFVIWTEGAIGLLDELWGTFEKSSELKKGYNLPISKLSNPDVTRLINSTEIQSVVRPVKGSKISKRPFTQKKNPLKNRAVLFRLNPYAKVQKRLEILEEERIKKGVGKKRGHKAKGEKVKKGEGFLKTLHAP